jgi:MFS superfamily sulfate permease-like transporter
VAALAGILIVVGVRMIDRNSLLPQVALDHPRLRRDRRGDRHGADGEPDRGLGRRHRAGRGAVHPRADRRFRWCAASCWATRPSPSASAPTRKWKSSPSTAAAPAIVELQGSLFFGTADQLYRSLEPELKTRDFLILDMRRIQTVDVTAAHLLEQVKDMLAERKGFLIFSQIPAQPALGRDLQQYFDQVGLIHEGSPVRVFPSSTTRWSGSRTASSTRPN